MYKNLIIAQDPNSRDRRMVGVQVDSKVLVEFLSEEGSDLVPLESLTADQLRVLIKTMLLDGLLDQ